MKLFGLWFLKNRIQEESADLKLVQAEVEEVVKKEKKIKISLDNLNHKKIITGILELYGYPHSSESCMNKQEKVMFVFGLMAVTQGLQRANELTSSFLEAGKYDDVEILCRQYYETYGHHIIPTENELEAPEIFSLLKTGQPADSNKKLQLPKEKK